MRLEVLLREERVVDLGALDPAEAEQRQRLRCDAEDVLEEDDAGRLVRYARVDLRWKSSTSDARVRRPRVAVAIALRASVAVEASPATTGARHGARRASKRGASCNSRQNPIILRSFQCAGLTIFCHEFWTISTVFWRSAGGAIFDEGMKLVELTKMLHSGKALIILAPQGCPARPNDV